uniref:Uncharacterized protein n=1 Tax=uncultured bacterium A1Q1_fos_485 TaxID=1256576 RepID=L7W083_9BACT|nr:hypothetical protein [uncultured bacterium A1Q1_fos_485]
MQPTVGKINGILQEIPTSNLEFPKILGLTQLPAAELRRSQR